MSTFADKDHVPEASNLLKELLSSHWKELGVEIKKADNVFRFLVSKLIFSEDTFTEQDKVGLFTSYERMVNKCADDKQFAAKHQWWVFLTRTIAQSLNNSITIEHRRKLKEQFSSLTSFGRGYFSASLYFGIKIKGEKLYQIWIKTRFPKRAKEKSFIGVGYRDKGHQREAHNGDPHWTELATVLYEHESVSTEERRQRLWDNLSINDLQRIGVRTSRF